MAIFTKKRGGGGGGGTTNTFANGLTEDTGLVEWGGSLYHNTEINMKNNDLHMNAEYKVDNKVRDFWSRATRFFGVLGVERTYGKDKKAAFQYVADASDIGEGDYGAGIGVIDIDSGDEASTRYRLDDVVGAMSVREKISDSTGTYEKYQNSSDSIETVTNISTGAMIETATDSSAPYWQKTVEDGTGDRNYFKVEVDGIEIEKLPNNRDDTGSVDQENQLYTDSNGKILSAPYKNSAWYGCGTGPSATTLRYVSPTIHTGATTGAYILGSADEMFFFPFSPSMIGTNQILGIRNVAIDTSGADGIIKHLVYEFDRSTGRPTNLFYDFGTFTTSTTRTAYDIVAVPSPLVLDYNKYYALAIVADSGSVRVRSHTNGTSLNPILGYTATGTSMIQVTYLSSTGLSGSFASPPTVFPTSGNLVNSSASNVIAGPLLIV